APYLPEELKLAASQHAELELVATPAELLVVRGTLVDGKALALARKTLRLRELPTDTGVSALTKDDGTFELRLVAPNDVALDIHPGDDDSALFDEERCHPFIRMAAAPTEPLRLVAEPCSRVSGRVTDAEGNPVMAATVSATRENAHGGTQREAVRWATTSRDG